MSGAGGATLDQAFIATPRTVRAIRHAVDEIAAGLGIDADRRFDIGVAVSEACANVVLHAYRERPEPGEMHVRAEFDGQRLDIVIGDAGGGLTPRTDSPGVGLGMPLMASLAECVEHRSPPSGGTELHLRFAV
jgi:anti-sigma regulatory factor (Ser/Thr protein kinase)